MDSTTPNSQKDSGQSKVCSQGPLPIMTSELKPQGSSGFLTPTKTASIGVRRMSGTKTFVGSTASYLAGYTSGSLVTPTLVTHMHSKVSGLKLPIVAPTTDLGSTSVTKDSQSISAKLVTANNGYLSRGNSIGSNVANHANGEFGLFANGNHYINYTDSNGLRHLTINNAGPERGVSHTLGASVPSSPVNYRNSSSRIVSGQQTIVGTRSWVDESRVHVVSERVTEQEVRIPKKITREEIIERVIIVPEKVVKEEFTEEIVKVRQRIIEVAKPTIHETTINVPEIEYIEKIVEVPEIITREKIREVPRIEFQERIIEVPRYVQQEKVVEVPEVEYIEVPYERFIDVPEVHEQIVLKHIPVPQYIDKPIPNYVNTEIIQNVDRQIPIPVESLTTLELKFPKIRTRYNRVDVPLYVPRFIEIAVPVEMMDDEMVANANHYAQQVECLSRQAAASLCEVENVGGSLKNADLSAFFVSFKTTQDMMTLFQDSWSSERFSVAGDKLNSIRSAVTTDTNDIGNNALQPLISTLSPISKDISDRSVIACNATLVETARSNQKTIHDNSVVFANWRSDLTMLPEAQQTIDLVKNEIQSSAGESSIDSIRSSNGIPPTTEIL